MKDLIKALQILLKYGNPIYPTHCEHDILNVNISSDGVSKEDIKMLDYLGFFVNEEDNTFDSYKFGSC